MEKKSRILTKMNSCFGDGFEQEILLAFDEDSLHNFCDLLCADEFDINTDFASRNSSTLLHLAVSSGRVEYVREILRRRDVNPNTPHVVLKKFPLHVAVENGQEEIVDLLLSCGASCNAMMENGSTPLHLAAVRSAARWLGSSIEETVIMQDSFSRIVRRLLSCPGVNFDCKNNIGVTPLFFAVDKGTEAVAKLLLDAGANVEVDVDGQTIEELIEEKMPDILENRDLTRNRVNTDSIESSLFQLLYTEAFEPGKFEEAWLQAEKNNNRVNVNATNGTYTFLQYCADQGHDKLVSFLLKKGADPNKFCSNYRIPPIVLAAHHGYYRVLLVFKDLVLRREGKVNFCAKDIIKGENVLHKVLKSESKAHVNSEFRDYDRCLDVLLEERSLFRSWILPAVNQPDQHGNTPIHVAAQLGKDEAVMRLLRSEANIGIKNNRMETPIAFISPLIMEQFLDECLQDNGMLTDDGFQMTFKYSFLGPPLTAEIKSKEDQEGLLANADGEENEKEDGLMYSEDLPEAEPLYHMAMSNAHRPLLAHPVITSFLCLKWRRIRPYFYINMVFYLLFVGVLTAYLLLLGEDLQHKTDEAAEVKLRPATTSLQLVTLVLTIALGVRELFQLLVSMRRYIFNLENLLEVAMIAIVLYLASGHADYTNLVLIKQLSATAILLSWAEMVLICGRHPKLSTYIKMFSTVSFNFMLFLSWYVAIIIAFGLAFFFMLQRPASTDTKQDGKEEDEPANAYFADPAKSMLKTLVMSLTGELEFEGIDFGNDYARIVFLLYIFFIMLVLVNLLNGLAVSDIAVIQKEAEILSYVSRVELITFMESMLLGDPFQFLTNWPPFAWGKKVPACDCFRTLYSVGPIRWFLTTVMGSTLLFKDRLVGKEAVFYPNKSLREQSKLPGTAGNKSDSKDDNDVGGKAKRDNLMLDEEIVESAKTLLVKRYENQEVTALVSKMKKIERSLNLLSQQQNLMLEMLNKKQ